MYLKIRKLGEKCEDTIITISKNALIQEMRQMIFEKAHVPISEQKLYYKGKQLNDDYRIMDYDIQLNDVIQLMVAVAVVDSQTTSSAEESVEEPVEEKLETSTSKYYKPSDLLDVVWQEQGAWIEARLEEILKKPGPVENERDLIYRIKFAHLDAYSNMGFEEIRPRSHIKLEKAALKIGQIVLVNYNIQDPTTRGCWYDFIIKKINRKSLVGTILVGKDRTPIEDITIQYSDSDEVFQIEKPKLLTFRFIEPPEDIPLRKNEYYCEVCKDVATKKCKDCGCSICAGKDNCNSIILCDECNSGYHIECLTPPLEEVPEDPEWYCPTCKVDENEIVKAGDDLKFSKKKSKMVSSTASTSRDWGHGMACVGRTTECTIVPKDHYGPIPGVEVGTCWKYRVQVSESGIHRPHVAGIHGRETDGAYSLVLSGGYIDDIDKGDEFIYSGSGGRDLSGNKRVNGQTSNQTLTRMNKALALNCKVPLNKDGAKAVDWKAGKPVRVVRNYKLAKHSKYAPKDGNRYDGIYKVVEYYPEKGKSGFLVWRYVLRRDDPSPAPWSKNGQELEMIYPPGFLEAEESKGKKTRGGVKRSLASTSSEPEKKKVKLEFKLPQDVEQLISEDSLNDKLWVECKSKITEGKQAFLAKVEEAFLCICCQEVTHLPVTIDCKHNVCQKCLKRSFKAEIYSCPCCRFEIGKDFEFTVNQTLSQILLNLFPGYQSGR